MKKMSILLLMTILVFSSCKKDDSNPSVPVNGNIQGNITNTSDGTAINGASVETIPPTNAVITNQLGDFTMSDVTPGTYIVTATKSGYDTNSVSISVISGKTTTANIQLSPTGTAPSAPTLLSPINNSTNISTTPTLIWNVSTGATSYTLQISMSSSFSSLVYNQSGLTATSKQVAGLSYSTTYYWRVSATNNYGTSGWLIIWYFTTSTPPSTPSLSSPSNGATNQSTSPTFSWNKSSTATSYTLQLSTDSSFSGYIYIQTGITDTNHQVNSLINFTKYYWRISAANSAGTSGWSNRWSFRTQSGYCSGTPTVLYSGKTYNTVQIGTQCWLKENLDVGVMIDSLEDPTNNDTIEKYCYHNDPNNCVTYGGLYQWDETMQYSTTSGTQGICPSGWHLPTTSEFQTLKTEVGGDGNALKAVGQGGGTNESGFSALLAGFRGSFGYYYSTSGIYADYFCSLGVYTKFWSSAAETIPTNAYHLSLGSLIPGSIQLTTADKGYGFSVRCVKD
jgi:uncharacterized protein (TIGR02145 family)